MKLFNLKQVFMASVLSFVAVGSIAQTSVDVFPEGQRLEYPQTVRVEQVSHDLLFQLDTAKRCRVEWANTTLHDKTARDRSELLALLHSDDRANPSMIEWVQGVPAFSLIDMTMDYDVARLMPMNNPMLSGEYVLSRSCGEPRVLVVSWRQGVKELPWRVRQSAEMYLGEASVELTDAVKVFTPFSAQTYSVQAYDAEHINVPKFAIIWLQDAPSEVSNQLIEAELAQWGALWHAK